MAGVSELRKGRNSPGTWHLSIAIATLVLVLVLSEAVLVIDYSLRTNGRLGEVFDHRPENVESSVDERFRGRQVRFEHEHRRCATEYEHEHEGATPAVDSRL